MNICFSTLGCKVNQIETEGLRELFLSRGHTCDKDKPYDVLIVNSCTVTAEGDRKTRQLFSKIKSRNPDAITVLTGCFPQAFPDKARTFGADITTGTRNRKSIVDLVESHARAFIIEPHPVKDEFEEFSVVSFEGHTRAFLKIQDGCDRFCSYCIIPYARGHIRTRRPECVEKAARDIAANGYKEITLTGINLSYYGAETGLHLYDGVRACDVPGIERIRLGSLQPDLLDDSMVSGLASVQKLCPQFHLSLQSGCDKTLKNMNRRYTTDIFRDTVKRLRTAFPDATFTTDIIVGFPGETEDDFLTTCRFAEEIRFLKVHVFPYSKRTGTPAAEMENQIENSVKKERSRRLISVCEDIRKRVMESFIGKEARVLAETGEIDGYTEGYTENYIPVLIDKSKVSAGDIVSCRLGKMYKGHLIGEII